MKTKLQRLTHYLIATLLGLLGFSACSDESNEEDEVLLMYGIPTAAYIVKGTVTDEAGNPIEGLQVAPYFKYGTVHSSIYPTTTTEKDGTFKLDTIKGAGTPPIVVADQDGEAHGGHFIPDTLAMNEFERTQLEEGQGWYDGVFELKADIKLKKKVKE
jgi:putative lipoprotein (rSAM/lipoprotein system)